ncbi:hypothetical protein ABZP36_028574 [Zizania latifolia]
MGAMISCCFCLPRRCPSPVLELLLASPVLEEKFCGLADDILEEIFLRLPAHPGCLCHVSLACKQFRRVVTSCHFLRRFCATHRDTPPLFGLFHNHNHGDIRFIPVNVDGTSYCLAPDNDAGLLVSGETDWNVIDCCGGLILLQTKNRLRLLIVEPMVGRCYYLPSPSDYKSLDFCNAAASRVRAEAMNALRRGGNPVRSPKGSEIR